MLYFAPNHIDIVYVDVKILLTNNQFTIHACSDFES